MSYIRASTKVPGQKNTSRTYAWWDSSGGIVIVSRGSETTNSEVRLSIPEFHYMASNFLWSFNKWYRRKGESVVNALKRFHRGFYKQFDEKWEIKFKKDLKRDWARLMRGQKRRNKSIQQMLKSLKNKKKSDENFRKMIEEEATKLLIREEADKKRMKKTKRRARK